MTNKNVIIYGAAGWLGRLTINYILKNHIDVNLILVSSKNLKANSHSSKQ